MDLVNRVFRLAARPVGLPKASDWTFGEEPVRAPEDGEILVENEYISLDPAMRGWMNEGRSYVPPVGLGEVMRAGAVGKVLASHNQRFAVGDHVVGMFGVQSHTISNGKGVTTVDPRLAPLPAYLGVLGMPGCTAYFGLLDVGKPRPGQTVVVSGAAGAVGAIVGQIAKIHGCHVVGIAGGPEKCAYIVRELGFDAAIDYKVENCRRALAACCPQGIDVFFDNVGGEILDAALTRLARGARVVICGAISQYNATEPKGPANYMSLLVNRASMTGMVVFDWADRYPEAIRALAGWRAEGKVQAREDIVVGLEQFPEHLLKLFRGENHGKLVLQVKSET